MAVNTIALAEVFQRTLDAHMNQRAATGFMVDNASQVEYNGGNKIKIPKMTMSGLGNYSRDSGYAKGGTVLEWEERVMTQDRGNQFHLDRMDVNETNFAANAENLMGVFQTEHVIPEVDAYRISKLATYAIGNTATAAANVEYGYTPDPTTIKAKLTKAVRKARLSGVQSVILANGATMDALEEAVGNQLRADSFRQGGFDETVEFFNQAAVIEVPDACMVTAIQTFNIDGSHDGGWAKGASAKDVNFIVIPRSIAIAVDKLDMPKIFTPDVVQDYDGWLIDYRRYHDLWVKDNDIKQIIVNIKQANQ